MRHTPPSSVVAVCGDSRRADLFDALLADPYDYDVLSVDSIARGYSRVKELRPDMVVIFYPDRRSGGLPTPVDADRGQRHQRDSGPDLRNEARRRLDALIAEIDWHISCAAGAGPMN